MKNIDALAQSLRDDLSPLHPSDLLSAFFYGVCLYPDDPCSAQDPARVALVFLDPAPHKVQQVAPFVKPYLKKGVVFSFALSPAFLQSSLDSFPLEVLEFKARHRVILGQDPLADLFVEDRHVRLQCERELKGKSLHLRSALLHHQTDRELHGLIHLSADDFHRIYLGIMKMKGGGVDFSRIETARKVSELCGLESDILTRVAKNDFPEKNVYPFYQRYLEQIDKLTALVDGGKL